MLKDDVLDVHGQVVELFQAGSGEVGSRVHDLVSMTVTIGEQFWTELGYDSVEANGNVTEQRHLNERILLGEQTLPEVLAESMRPALNGSGGKPEVIGNITVLLDRVITKIVREGLNSQNGDTNPEGELKEAIRQLHEPKSAQPPSETTNDEDDFFADDKDHEPSGPSADDLEEIEEEDDEGEGSGKRRGRKPKTTLLAFVEDDNDSIDGDEDEAGENTIEDLLSGHATSFSSDSGGSENDMSRVVPEKQVQAAMRVIADIDPESETPYSDALDLLADEYRGEIKIYNILWGNRTEEHNPTDLLDALISLREIERGKVMFVTVDIKKEVKARCSGGARKRAPVPKNRGKKFSSARNTTYSFGNFQHHPILAFMAYYMPRSFKASGGEEMIKLRMFDNMSTHPLNSTLSDIGEKLRAAKKPAAFRDRLAHYINEHCPSFTLEPQQIAELSEGERDMYVRLQRLKEEFGADPLTDGIGDLQMKEKEENK